MYSRVPDYRIALVEQGREEARTAGRHVAELIGKESFGVYVSPYLRTMQTKECILTQIGHAPLFDYQDPCLREQDTGNLPGVLEAASNREARGQYCHLVAMERDGNGKYELTEPFAETPLLSQGVADLRNL